MLLQALSKLHVTLALNKKTKPLCCTVDWEIFMLKMFFVTQRFRNVACIRILFFHAFNFRRSAYGQKYFNGKISRSTVYVLQERIRTRD